MGGMRSPHRDPVGKHNDMFPAPHWRDLWAAILFYLHLAGLVAVSVYAFINVQHVELPPSVAKPEVNDTVTSLILIGLAAAATVSVGLTVLCLGSIRRAPERMIHISFIANILWTGALAVWTFIVGNWISGLIFSILAVITVVFYLVVRNRIPFSAIILQTVVDGLRAYPNMLSVTSGSVAVSVVFLAYMSSTLVSLIALRAYGQDKNATWMIVYSVFSMFWTSQVLKGSMQTVIAGVYATYYFLHGTGQMIVSPVAQSLRRALSYSFGSICFGSLIVALIQTLRFLLSVASRDRDSLASAIADCVLDIIQGLVEYFNYYAYTQIAIYGKPYIQAARDTWRLVKSRGVDAIVNDSLVGTCTGMLTLGIGLVAGFVVFVISAFIYREPSAMCIVVSINIGLLSMIVPYVAFVILEAGSTTLFVCLAEDPASLQRTKPELYNAIMQKYSMMWA